MRHAARIAAWIRDRTHWPILAILCVAFALRVAGIRYGLPMWLVADEPSSIFGALKMIELKTLVPTLHQDVFAGTFYYGVTLPYAYLAPFLAAMGLKFLSFGGTFVEFKNLLVSDPSIFFLIARTISALIGTATVYVIYRAAQELFEDERAALASASFLAFSLLHVDFSHWARHWIPVTFCFSLVILALAHRAWPIGKRYVFAALVAGAGVGISVQAGLAALFILLWFFLVDRLPVRTRMKEKWFWKAIFGFLALIVLAFLLWTKSFDFLFSDGSTEAVRIPKTIAGLVAYYGFHARNLLMAEPILLLFLLIGIGAAFKRKRGLCLAASGFIIMYFTVFYLFFSALFDRYILMLSPLFALLAGYGLARAFDVLARRNRQFAHIVFLFPLLTLAPTLIFDVRLIRNDTRISAYEWVVAHVPAGAKVAVLSPLMRMPTDALAVAEQERIDAKSIRSADAAERDLSATLVSPRFHALNLGAVTSPDFFRDLPSYLRNAGYDYLILTPEYLKEKGAPPETAQLGESAAFFAGFTPTNRNGSLTEGFGDGMRELFSPLQMGPDILIRKLR